MNAAISPQKVSAAVFRYATANGQFPARVRADHGWPEPGSGVERSSDGPHYRSFGRGHCRRPTGGHLVEALVTALLEQDELVGDEITAVLAGAAANAR